MLLWPSRLTWAAEAPAEHIAEDAPLGRWPCGLTFATVTLLYLHMCFLPKHFMCYSHDAPPRIPQLHPGKSLSKLPIISWCPFSRVPRRLYVAWGCDVCLVCFGQGERRWVFAGGEPSFFLSSFPPHSRSFYVCGWVTALLR